MIKKIRELIDKDFKNKKMIKKLRLEFLDMRGLEFFDSFNEIINTIFRNGFKNGFGESDIKILHSVPYGTFQWSERTLNMMDKNCRCGNCCLYCYINKIFHYYFENVEKCPNREEFIQNANHLQQHRKSKVARLIMTPSSHDIFPSMIENYIKMLKGYLQAGHDLLIVSKPRIACIKLLCSGLDLFKTQIRFRFTITANDDQKLTIWEPNAPLFAERVESLQHAFDQGFKTSVSMEPFLVSPIKYIDSLRKYVTNEFWIGMMNDKPNPDVLGRLLTDIETADLKRIEDTEYSRDNVQSIVKTFIDDDKIYWKESIIKMFIRKDNRHSSLKKDEFNNMIRNQVPKNLQRSLESFI